MYKRRYYWFWDLKTRFEGPSTCFPLPLGAGVGDGRVWDLGGGDLHLGGVCAIDKEAVRTTITLPSLRLPEPIDSTSDALDACSIDPEDVEAEALCLDLGDLTNLTLVLLGVLDRCTGFRGAWGGLCCNLSNSSRSFSNWAPVVAKVVVRVCLLLLLSWFQRRSAFSKSWARCRWIKPSVNPYSAACANFSTTLRSSTLRAASDKIQESFFSDSSNSSSRR